MELTIDVTSSSGSGGRQRTAFQVRTSSKLTCGSTKRLSKWPINLATASLREPVLTPSATSSCHTEGGVAQGAALLAINDSSHAGGSAIAWALSTLQQYLRPLGCTLGGTNA